MKNQYFADATDYTKYSILRQFPDTPKIIYWMLTKDDNPNYLRKLKYLESRPCASFDKNLWDHLLKCVKNDWRNVSFIEGWLGKVVHYEKRSIDDWVKRKVISNDVISMSGKDQIVFLDPDNGYEIPSCLEGTSGSSKYVYDFEISGLLEKGAVVILFQHLRMGQKVNNMIHQFSDQWKSYNGFAVRTNYALYYFLSNSDLDWAIQKLKPKKNDNPHTKLRLLSLQKERMIEFTKLVLSPHGLDDLDCAGWALQEILNVEPENTEVAELLKEIIARIDQRFDAGDSRGTNCHIIMGRESPSPYVCAKESARLNK